MDRLPQIPRNEGANDTGGLLREVFQENIESEIFPLEVAENISKYVLDAELCLEDIAYNVLLINQHSVTETKKIKQIECTIIKDHGNYLCNKHVIEQNILLRELSKLKSCDIFTSLHPDDVEKYGLIQKCNLYPDMVRQFLDFRFNKNLHQYKCLPTPVPEKKKVFKEKKKSHLSAPRTLESAPASKLGFIFDPREVNFFDFETGKVYEQTIKIMNVSANIQKICLKTPPKFSVFKIVFNSERMASGMSIYATVRFTPKVKLNLQDEVIFTYKNGPEIKVPIRSYRYPPKLLGYIRKSNDPQNIIMERSIPGSNSFLKQRRNAVNDTIDCGSCFVTDYVLLNLLLVNSGTDAKFFLISEDDFFNEDINSVSTSLEFYDECIWIYPTYFEIPARESLEINIIFQPTHSGLYTKNLVLMCDNNTYKGIEIVGDSVSFNRSLISVDIPHMVKDIDKQEDHCIFLGQLKTEEFIRLTLCINNHSSLYLKYEFQFDTCDKNCNTEDDKCNMSTWIKITNLTPVLPPYSVTDTIFHVKPNCSAQAGYYKCRIRLFITGIPIASFEEDQTFLVATNDTPLKKIVENLSVVDVLILDVTVACYVEPQLQINQNPTMEKNVNDDNIVQCQGCCEIPCLCVDCKAPIPTAALVFSETLLDMGILPTGVNIQKQFDIMNLGKEMVSWKITEIKYNMSRSPHVDFISENNLSSNSGTLGPGRKKHIRYTIGKKPPTRWVSVLVLFSITSGDNDNYSLVAESICVLTYEISELNIVITNSASTEPILCPLEMLYTGVPHQFSFKIQNYSLIGGCFYFLKPIGKDADKIQVEYKPQYGELKPRSQYAIKLTLTCNDVGILENIFLPCFVGRGQEPIMVRLLCVVDCIHVFFYLPNNISEYEKVLWPPKVLYEYERSWTHDYCMCEELFEEYENIIQNIQSENTIQIMENSSKTLTDIKISRAEMDGHDLLQTLVDADSELFLQNCVMQVENVSTKHPTKITFYIENVTPKTAKYTIQSTNYAAKENLIKDALNTSYKTTAELWEPLIDKHGILVHPERESGSLNSHGLLTANIWIYANTWGIYTEEIVVDIEEIACFVFTVIIDVVGCPLEIPLGVGAITKHPTIRFGSVASGDDSVTKNIVMLNTSSIDFNISWHMFYDYEACERKNAATFNFVCDAIGNSDHLLSFDFTDRFYGMESGDRIQIQPSLLHLAGHSKIILPITFKPWLLTAGQKKDNMKCRILGKIFLSDENRFKSNYYYRKGVSFLMEATATVEKPSLDITVEAENNTLYVYANEITLNRDAKVYLQINARNVTSSVVKARLGCSEPFGVDGPDKELIFNPGQCKKIKLLCKLSYEKIVKWGPHVYNLTELKDNRRPSLWDYGLEEKMTDDAIFSLSHDKTYVDEDMKVLTLPRKLFVNYKGGLKDVIPINIGIYYPNIAVKPIHIKFGYLLIGRTQKTSIAVYNLTGYRVLFEILKSTSNQEIVVTPCYGEIEKSVGVHHSFVNITIYFTPLECRNYQESIRICTNIPQYHIDIPIKGAGSYNEKFDGGA